MIKGVYFKRILLPAFLFIFGFWGGDILISRENKTAEQDRQISDTKVNAARPSEWKKINGSTGGHLRKTFTASDLKELKGWLEKQPTSEQIEQKLRELMRYPFKKSDQNLYLSMLHLFSYWGQMNPCHAFESVMKLSGPWITIKADLVQTALAAPISNNPAEVASWFSDKNNGLYVYQEILPSLSRSLTQKSPDESWKWLSSLPYLEQSKAFAPFFEEVFLSHPERLEDFIKRLEPPENWGSSSLRSLDDQLKIEKVVGLYAKVNYDAASEWVESFPDRIKYMAYESLLEVRAEEEPAEALRLMNSLPESKGRILNIIATVVIASNDPEKISSWLQELAKNDPDVGSSANYGFVRLINPEESAQMIENLPAGKVKDGLISQYVTSNLNPDQEKAKHLLEQMQEAGLKEFTSEYMEKNKIRKKDKDL